MYRDRRTSASVRYGVSTWCQTSWPTTRSRCYFTRDTCSGCGTTKDVDISTFSPELSPSASDTATRQYRTLKPMTDERFILHSLIFCRPTTSSDFRDSRTTQNVVIDRQGCRWLINFYRYLLIYFFLIRELTNCSIFPPRFRRCSMLMKINE